VATGAENAFFATIFVVPGTMKDDDFCHDRLGTKPDIRKIDWVTTAFL
jgi:hypothetical protein